MSFDEILDLTADVFLFNALVTYSRLFSTPSPLWFVTFIFIARILLNQPFLSQSTTSSRRLCAYLRFGRSQRLISLTRVTKSYDLALGTNQISSFFTKHWTKFLSHQTGNYPVTCFVSKPSRITLVELSIINTSYQKLPFDPVCIFANKFNISPTVGLELQDQTKVLLIKTAFEGNHQHILRSIRYFVL